jgi:hypothetical protein
MDETIREVEHVIALEPRLREFLDGDFHPTGVKENKDLAEVCMEPSQKLYVVSVRLFCAAFESETESEICGLGCRTEAARAAALASTGRDADPGKLDDGERARLRMQALDWLRRDLAGWSQHPDRALVHKRILGWQEEEEFACVRDADELAKLRNDERAAWQKLWSDVADLLKRTEETKPAVSGSVKR